MEAEKCWEAKGSAQGRWKQKGGWEESQGQGGYLGHFYFKFFVFIVKLTRSIATAQRIKIGWVIVTHEKLNFSQVA